MKNLLEQLQLLKPEEREIYNLIGEAPASRKVTLQYLTKKLPSLTQKTIVDHTERLIACGLIDYHVVTQEFDVR